MATAKDIRRRIKTVKNIEKITGAMKMVAAARLKKAQLRAESARPYAEKMHEVLQSLSVTAGEVEHPLLEIREEKNVAFVIVGAERGLAGSYNVNLVGKALDEIGRYDRPALRLFVVGKKAIAFFRRRAFDLIGSLEVSGADVSFSDVRTITNRLRGAFENRDIDSAYLVYSRFVSAMQQEPTAVKLLPMTPPESDIAISDDYIFEPNAAELLGDLLPRYLETQVYQALVEAQASEHGARMTAMSAATQNAGEMIDTLTLAYNKARQAAITKEITEIVSGAEAQR